VSFVIVAKRPSWFAVAWGGSERTRPTAAYRLKNRTAG
jgi:hypothetical protein